jgi:hypothetical protein
MAVVDAAVNDGDADARPVVAPIPGRARTNCPIRQIVHRVHRVIEGDIHDFSMGFQ